MAELVLQQQLVEAAKERNGISKALLAIQHTLDKMVPAISLMESVLGKLEPAVTTTDAPAKAPPTRVLGTNPDTPAMDGGDIPALTPTNCSTKGMSQSHDYVDEQHSAAAIPNTTMSELLPVTTLVPDPESMMLKDTQANTISPDASVFVCPNDKLDTAYELFDKKPLHAHGDLVASVLLDTGQPIISIAIDPHQVTNQDLGAELRPRPWPSFVCRHGQERTRLPLNQAIALLLLNKHPSVEALLGCQLTSFFSSKHMMVAPGDVTGNRCKYKTQINCWFPTPVCAWMDRASLPLLEPFGNSMITSIEAMELDMLFSLAAKQFLRAPYEVQRMGYAISYGNSCIVAVILLAGLTEDLSCTQYKCSLIILGRCHIVYSMAHWLESDWYYSLIFISNSLGMGLLHDDYFQVLESTFLAGQLIQCDFKLNQCSCMGQLELEMVTLMAILKGEFTSRCLQIHLNKNAQVKFPWSSCYLFLQVGKLQDVMVELKTCFSVKWFLSAVTFLLNLHDIVCCNKAMSIQSLDIPFCMAECCGMLIQVILTHRAWLLKISSPYGSPEYVQVWIGSVLCIWTSHGAHIDKESFSVQPPLMDQELWRTTEYWLLDIQGLPLADAFSEDSFWPEQHIIEACLASPYHRFMVAIAVEWLYTRKSYGELIAVSNQLKGKDIVTTRLLSSDEIKCLEALASILQCTDNYLPVIMFDEIELQLTVHWMKLVVLDKAIVVSNITKPTMVGTPVNHLCLEEYLVCPSHNFYSAPEVTLSESRKLEFNNKISYTMEQYTDVNSYMTKIGLHPLYASISMAERTSHRNNPIHQLVEQRLSFPASTCKQADIKTAISKHQGAYSLCRNCSCDFLDTIATWIEYPDRQGVYLRREIIMDQRCSLGCLNLGVLLTWPDASELPCTGLGSQKHPVSIVDQLMLKSFYGCHVLVNTSPKIFLECSGNQLVSCNLSQSHAADFYIDYPVQLGFEFTPLMVWKIAWVLRSVRTVVVYSSQCAFFTQLDGWPQIGQQRALRCTSLIGHKDYLDFEQVCVDKSYYIDDAGVFDLDRFNLDTFLGQVSISHDYYFYLIEVSLDYSYQM